MSLLSEDLISFVHEKFSSFSEGHMHIQAEPKQITKLPSQIILATWM